MPESPLYQRYMKAYRAHRDHRAACSTCTDEDRCVEGQEVWAAFARAQDTYLKRRRG
ncbi:hypothetical protein [Streptomyces daghestanicus]|uniref:Uncharacterized protein n=1 Tax=Streptomyces daghestanicus TaxID=66885 RepID=A0ABQ3Q7K0_9ACTN|nr:hypothetical protein [Streptomyces daghestanicus]GGU66429.1 hypothetical protein GCM10010259_65890 [Streptomyces daghestanicus]GHI33227.1 hypothetical protein Sdagh_49570 [Streptomyces daghestanicus]